VNSNASFRGYSMDSVTLAADTNTTDDNII